MGTIEGAARLHRPGDELPDNCKLYVAGLTPSFDDEALRTVFGPFGTVLHAAVIKDQVTGAPRFGFVHFPDTQAARTAADGLNGKMLNDDGQQHMLIVKLRSERHSHPAGGPGMHAYDESKLYVAGLGEGVSEVDVRTHFASVAPVAQVRLITDKVTGLAKGYAFVTMASKEAAAAAMDRLDGAKWREGRLSVQVAGDKSSRSRGNGGAPGARQYISPHPNPHMASLLSHGPPGYGRSPAFYQPNILPTPCLGAPPPGYGTHSGYVGALPGYGYMPLPASGPPPLGCGVQAYGAPMGYGALPQCGRHPGGEAALQSQPPLPGQPPLPSVASVPQPPLPAMPPPLPADPVPFDPAQVSVQSEYERFLFEMTQPQ